MAGGSGWRWHNVTEHHVVGARNTYDLVLGGYLDHNPYSMYE